ncbi:ATP/GTP-binding protein [Roseibium algicola]|uniref:Murein endopeptidase K n=1 Tax=Roseibium algicola TaxID=2857014 RepID=A0ABM6IAC2_9HYPH|nr:ATP/GTP-binding protein [Roseibium aggregatum]
MKRAAKAAGAFAVVSVCLVTFAQAETRTLKLYNTHTKERVSITFKKNGRYLPDGLREANRFLRDWRRNEMTKIDPELLDLVWEVYQKVGASQPIHVVSSYRSPATNNMLRKRSSGVAKNSQHTLGKAMDFFIPGVKLATLRATGLRKEVGGVGYYPRSGSPFVHMDTGSVRHWPRMSRSELARVFPDGKTLHFPSDGKPMSGYKVALAESKSGRSRSSKPTIVASNTRSSSSNGLSTRDQNLTRPGKPIPVTAQDDNASSGGGNLFASLFGGGNNRDNTSKRPGAVGNTTPAPVAEAPAVVIENPPVPSRKVLESEPEAPAAAPIVVASNAPIVKPPADIPAVAASKTPPPAPNTLDAQRFAIETGQPGAPTQGANPAPEKAIDSRFQVASRTPQQKPSKGLSDAAKVAAANLGLTGDVPVPGSAPTDDPVAAIAAATGTSVPSPVPAPRSETTLAYASASAAPTSLSRSLRPSVSEPARAQANRPAAGATAKTAPARQQSVSGRIPRDQIVDPLAGFASLPDKSAPTLLSGAGTTRHQTFAWLSHPNQRQLKNVMMPGNRFVSASFENNPYGDLRTDRFDGPAVVILPVRFAR